MATNFFPVSYKDQPDDQLLNALAGGDQLALAELYERYWFPLLRTAFQKVNSQEVAEELVQDLFVQLWQKRETLEIRQVSSYLFTAVKYSAIDHIRKQVVQENFREYLTAFLVESDNHTEDQLIYHDLIDSIETELVKLPAKTQAIFRLSRFDGQSIPEIAHHLNLSEKAVEYHLSKALKILREHLRDVATLLLYVFLFQH